MKLTELKNDWRLRARALLADGNSIYTVAELKKTLGIIGPTNYMSNWLQRNYTVIKYDSTYYYGMPEAIVVAKKIWRIK